MKADCVHHLFEALAAKEPDRVAVTSSGGALTYGELNTRAEQLASQLGACGVGPEMVVGLCVPRSAAMLVGASGILKSGAAYLPIDPSEPEARSESMLTDAGVSVLVMERSLNCKAGNGNRRVILLDKMGASVGIGPDCERNDVQVCELASCPPATERSAAVPAAATHDINERESLSSISSVRSRVVAAGTIRPTISSSEPPNGDKKTGLAGSNQLAYVIYTSGSTGTPKGVEIAHESLSNLVSWHQRAFQITANDRASCVARVGFDASVWEIWPYLATGASLHVPDDDRLNDPEALQAWLISQGITISFVPTPMAERLLALSWPAAGALRIMLTGGDALHVYPPPGLPFALVNNYGPTECAVVATSSAVPATRTANRLPPIGRPIANTKVYLLDENMAEVPAGTPGEMYIGGIGVARGYRNRPELTAQRFIANPFAADGGRLFRTGDRAQYLVDGQLAFLGRVDEQIKIRGFRIEPSEIIAVLDDHPSVSQSVVVPREVTAGDLRLVAYVVPNGEALPTCAGLREFLGSRLPDYMLPAMFVRLDTMPLTPNGKVDRAALPVPDAANTIGDGAIHKPQTEVEEIVARTVAPLLGLEQVDVEANFFSLGGHSLLGIQLISRLRESLGVELSLRTVFEAPSVVELSAEIERLLCAKLEAMSEDEVERTLNAAGKSSS